MCVCDRAQVITSLSCSARAHCVMGMSEQCKQTLRIEGILEQTTRTNVLGNF